MRDSYVTGWVICRALGTYTKAAAELYENGRLVARLSRELELVEPVLDFNPGLGWCESRREERCQFPDRGSAELALATYLLINGG